VLLQRWLAVVVEVVQDRVHRQQHCQPREHLRRRLRLVIRRSGLARAMDPVPTPDAALPKQRDTGSPGGQMKQISGQTPAMNQAITCRSYSARCISYAAGKTAATTTLTVSLGWRRFSTHPTEQRQWFISVWGLGLHWCCDPVHPPPEEADHVRRGTVLPASHRRSDHRRQSAVADQRTKHVAKVRVMCILVRDRWWLGQNWCPHVWQDSDCSLSRHCPRGRGSAYPCGALTCVQALPTLH
jgi:hypothetical protein